VSPHSRLMIAIRLSWLCNLGILGKRESTYTCLENKKNTRRTHKRKGERDHISRESLEKSFQIKLECMVPKRVKS
jgi:hypothetical protein